MDDETFQSSGILAAVLATAFVLGVLWLALDMVERRNQHKLEFKIEVGTVLDIARHTEHHPSRYDQQN